MSDTDSNAVDRLEADVRRFTNGCAKDYARHVDDEQIATTLRNIADRYDPNRAVDQIEGLPILSQDPCLWWWLDGRTL